MNPILLYLLQVITCSGILYGYYHFFLRNKRFHQYNRFYLLAMTLTSLIVPFLNIPVYFSSQADIPVIYQMLSEVRAGDHPGQSKSTEFFQPGKIVYLFYWLVAIIIFFRLCISLGRLKKILNKYPAEKMGNISFVNTGEENTPFSFFRWLFWNNKISFDSDRGQKIFRHEFFHIQQKHSWDIICLEAVTIVFWVNPFFHLAKKEIKTIHEFLADQFAAAGNEDKSDYAELLVMQVLQTRQQLVNPFFHNQIKRRIAMITNSPKPSYQYLRKTMVLPVAAAVISLIIVNCTSKDIKRETPPAHSSKPILENVEIEPAFRGGHTEWVKYLQKNLNPFVPVDKGASEGEYTVYVQFIVDIDGSISEIKALTNHGFGMEEEALRVIAKGPRWLPAIQNGHAVKSYKKQPLTFQIEEE